MRRGLFEPFGPSLSLHMSLKSHREHTESHGMEEPELIALNDSVPEDRRLACYDIITIYIYIIYRL